MAIRGNSTWPRALGLEPPSDCLMSYPEHLLMGFSPLCRDPVGVFNSPGQLSWTLHYLQFVGIHFQLLPHKSDQPFGKGICGLYRKPARTGSNCFFRYWWHLSLDTYLVLRVGCDSKSIFKGNKANLNFEFFFSWKSCLNRTKETSQLYKFLITRGGWELRRNGFMLYRLP